MTVGLVGLALRREHYASDDEGDGEQNSGELRYTLIDRTSTKFLRRPSPTRSPIGA